MTTETCGHDLSEGYFLHSVCHDDWPTWCHVNGDLVTVICAKCDKAVAKFRTRPMEDTLETEH